MALPLIFYLYHSFAQKAAVSFFYIKSS